MKKRFLQFAFAFLFLVGGGLSAFAAPVLGGGNGSQSKPYLIRTTAQFDSILHCPNSNAGGAGLYFRLENDIDLGTSANTPFVFKGNLDGQNFVVKNNTATAIFSGVDGATVSNLLVDLQGNVSQGVFANFVNGVQGVVLFENCRVFGAGTITGGPAGVFVSASSSSSNLTIRNCFAGVGFNAPGSRSGGFIGEMNGTVLIDNSQYWAPAAIATGGSGSFGGMVGNVASGSLTIQNSNVTGLNVTGAGSNVGGLIGESNGQIAINSTSVINIQIAGTGSAYGGLVGLIPGPSSPSNDVISQSYVLLNTGGISGVDRIGGLVGVANKTGAGSLAISKSYVAPLHSGIQAKLIASNAATGIGGLVGASVGNALNMTDCSLNAQLSQNGDGGSVSIVANTAAINYVGGLVGKMANGSLNHCFAYMGFGGLSMGQPNIQGKTDPITGGAIGGLVGDISNTTINQCFAVIGNPALPTAGIEIAAASRYVGGLVGNTNNNDVIKNSFAYVKEILENGNTLADYIGGIAGKLGTGGSISDCWFVGEKLCVGNTVVGPQINRIVGNTMPGTTIQFNKGYYPTQIAQISPDPHGTAGDKNGADNTDYIFNSPTGLMTSGFCSAAPYTFTTGWTYPTLPPGNLILPQQVIAKSVNAYLVYGHKTECSNVPTTTSTIYGYNFDSFTFTPVNEGGVLGTPVSANLLSGNVPTPYNFTPTYAAATFANGPVTYGLNLALGTPAVNKNFTHIKVYAPVVATVIPNTRTICDDGSVSPLVDTVLVKFTGGFAPYTFTMSERIDGGAWTALGTAFTYGDSLVVGMDSIARFVVNPASAKPAPAWWASLSEYQPTAVNSTVFTTNCAGTVGTEFDSIFANPVFNAKLQTANTNDSVVCAGDTIYSFSFAHADIDAATGVSTTYGDWYYVWSDEAGRATSIGMDKGRDSIKVKTGAPVDSVTIAKFKTINTIGRSDSAQIYAYAMFKNKAGHMCYASDSAYIELQVNPTPNLRFKVNGQTTIDGYQIACNGAQSDSIYFVTGINTTGLNPMDTVYYQWGNEMHRKDHRLDSMPFAPVYSIRNAADSTTYTPYIIPFNTWNDGVYVVPNAVRDSIIVAAYFVDGAHNLVCTSDTVPTVVQINPTTTIVDQLIGGKYCDAKDTTAHVGVYGVDVSYQWYKNDFAEKNAAYAPILNATRSTERLKDNAYYFVKVSSLCGTFNSDTVRFDFAKSPEFITNLAGNDTSICAGSNAVLTSEVKGAIGYQWFFEGDSIKGATKATYTITNADPEKDYGYYQVRAIAACDNYSVNSKSDRVWVASPLTNLEIKGLPNPVDLNKEYEISIDSAGKPYDDVTYYVWSFSNSNAKFEANAGDETFYVNKVVFGPTAQNGVMTVKLSHVCGTNGIYTVTKNVNVNGSSISDVNKESVSVYPNPVVDELFIDNANGAVNEVTVTDLNGRKVASYSNLNDVEVITISAANWSKGVYFVTVKSDNGTDTAKIIKK